MSFLIRKSTDQHLFAVPRSLSQLITSFIGSWCQGIRPMLFIAWSLGSLWKLYESLFLFLPLTEKLLLKFLSLFSFQGTFSVFFKKHFLFFKLLEKKKLSFNFGGDEESRTPDPLLARQVLSQLSYTPTLFNSLWGLFLMRYAMVGLSGLEPPTSRLSGVRSNHLSYKPSGFHILFYRTFKNEQCSSTFVSKETP